MSTNATSRAATLNPFEPTISVVIVTFNRRELLGRCLDSIQSQEVVPFEVIVVDNASTDDTLKFVEENYPKIKILYNSTNLGFCGGNNQGIRAASAPLVALLNNDAEADPNWLGELMAGFDNRGDVAMVASKILQFEDPSKIDKVGHLIYWDGQNRGRGMGELDQGQYDQAEEVLWPDGCAAAYRRDAVLAVGAFDEDFFAYADDADLGFRLRLAGYKAVYAPKAKVLHRRGSTLGRTNPFRIHLIERNRVLLAVKLFPWPLLLLNPFFYALRLLRGVWSAFLGKGESARHAAERGKLGLAATLLKADLEAVRMIPRMLAKRREIASFRRLSTIDIFRLMWRFRISLKTLMEDEP